MSNLQDLPQDLPIPEDDGAAAHLVGMDLPGVQLVGTDGINHDLSELTDRQVIYCYPKTGQPGVALPDGWDEIPGARGCTPQSCSFRDHHAELTELGAGVFGLSTQSTEYQREMVERLNLPYAVLSDQYHEFTKALSLPTFKSEGDILLKRLTMIVQDGRIEAVHYPVFPSDQDPIWVMDYLKKHP